MMKSIAYPALLAMLALTACQAPSRTASSKPPAATALPSSSPAAPTAFFPGKLAEMDAAINETIGEKSIPGGVLWLERNGSAYHKAYGRRALIPAEEAMTEDTIFDLASLTKVIAGTPAMMLLIERGQAGLDDPVQKFVPEFTGDGKEHITIRHLMTHTSGLRPDIDTRPAWSGHETAIRMACAEKLRNQPGTYFRYSDINLFMLGEVIERITGKKLNEFVESEVYRPLRMFDTGFLPPESKLARIAPTEKIGDRVLRGVVHDPTARYMGGVAGHAGLFSTAADLARYCRMMLNGGELDGVRVFKPETVKLMTTVQSPDEVPARRGLGWDIDSGYSRPRGKIFPLGSYGHTGFTGTSVWIDPFSRTFWIFLSNRVHPDGKGNVLPLQARLANMSAEAVRDFNFNFVPGSLAPRPPAETPAPSTTPRTTRVLNGIDVLKRDQFASLKGLRVGLITNHTGHDSERIPTIDLLFNTPGVQLKALFSPEHGIRGLQDEQVSDSVDEKTHLPVYSLYGDRRIPSPEQLRELDALVFDIQDIGCRFYTYIATMGNCLEAAGNAGLKFFVLDRPDPINGIAVEGPIHTGKSSFVAYHTTPLRTGMTLGELARMFQAERFPKAKLTVIPVENWSRAQWFDQTSLPWTNPSPNMRSLAEAILYPGIGLLETAISVGRGTDTPFEVVGAPYVKDTTLAEELNRAGLPGVRFVPVRFTPRASVFKGKACGGVNIIVTDRDAMHAVDVGILIASALQRLYPKDFALEKFNTLLQQPPTLEIIKRGGSLAEIKKSWEEGLESFQIRRAKYLLYK